MPMSMLELKRFFSKAHIKKRGGIWRVTIAGDVWNAHEFPSFEAAAAFAKKIWPVR